VENAEADKDVVNNDGMSHLSLVVRFGRWDMFDFARRVAHSPELWRFGLTRCRVRDLSHFDIASNVHTRLGLRAEVQALRTALFELDESYPGEHMSLEVDQHLRALQENVAGLCDEDSSAADEDSELVAVQLRLYREERIAKHMRGLLAADGDLSGGDRASGGNDEAGGAKEKELVKFRSVIEVIRLYKPQGWSEKAQDFMVPLVMSKWRKCYWLAYIGDKVIPLALIFVLFGIMWLYRNLSLRNNAGLPGWRLPTVDPALVSPEAQCGWGGVRDSVSGRIQAVLVFYGMLTLLVTAWFQWGTVHIRDLDPSGFFQWGKFTVSPIATLVSRIMLQPHSAQY
jgi:hypothetical protein